MNYDLMFQVTAKLQKVKPSKFVFAYVTASYLLNCFMGHCPADHTQTKEYTVKYSKEALQAFKQCFPKGEVPEVKIG